MPEEIVAQVKLDLTRKADQNPAGQKLEDALDRRDAHQFQGVGQQLFASYPALQAVHGVAQHQRKENPHAVVNENADCAYEIAAAVLPQARKKWTQALGQHVLLVDAILPAQASIERVVAGGPPATTQPTKLNHPERLVRRLPAA